VAINLIKIEKGIAINPSERVMEQLLHSISSRQRKSALWIRYSCVQYWCPLCILTAF